MAILVGLIEAPARKQLLAELVLGRRNGVDLLDAGVSFSFPPAARTDARLLLLGSLPGARSLEAQEYYAHERNAFWRLMGRLFNFESDMPYAERLRRLADNRVGPPSGADGLDTPFPSCSV